MTEKQKFFLSDMELDEISTVALGDNPTADILIIKSGKCPKCGSMLDADGSCAECGYEVSKKGCTCAWPKQGMQSNAGTHTKMPRCPDCGGQTQQQRMSKMMPGPDTVHHQKPLDEKDFKYAKKLKRKKKLSVMRGQALDGVSKLAAAQRRHIR